jgi:pimeloyl-ACP methyl ester carboxylesterase
MDRRISKPVYVYHGEADPNAPLGSVRELLADATDVRWNIDESASHITMAQDETGNIIGHIFEAISTRSRAEHPSV